MNDTPSIYEAITGFIIITVLFLIAAAITTLEHASY